MVAQQTHTAILSHTFCTSEMVFIIHSGDIHSKESDTVLLQFYIFPTVKELSQYRKSMYYLRCTLQFLLKLLKRGILNKFLKETVSYILEKNMYSIHGIFLS